MVWPLRVVISFAFFSTFSSVILCLATEFSGVKLAGIGWTTMFSKLSGKMGSMLECATLCHLSQGNCTVYLYLDDVCYHGHVNETAGSVLAGSSVQNLNGFAYIKIGE